MAWARYNLLIALAILSLSLGVQGQIGFPYCRCVDYNDYSSPYVAVLQSTSSSSSSFTAVFKVVNASKPANPTPCYNKILASGVPKIEFDSSYTCLSSGNKPVVKINGVVSQASGIVKPPNYNGKAAIKAKFIPNYMGEGVTITITGYGACANWNTLFNAPALGVFSFAVYSDDNTCCPTGKIYPPPPPTPKPIQPGESPLQPGELSPPMAPPVGPPFPFCRCDRATANTPYSFDIASVKMTSDATYNWYTGPISVSSASGGKCSDMTLYKIEVSIRDECKSSVGKVAYIYTKSTGVTSARTVSITNYGPGRSTVKVSRLPWDTTTADGSTLAIGLYKNSACPTFADIIPPGAMLAFFNNGNCCPSFPLV